MKAFLTSRSDLRWALAALPAIFLAHWIAISLIPMLLHTPWVQSMRAVMSLI